MAKVGMPYSLHQRRRDVVLGGQRVGGAERPLGAARFSVIARFAVSVVTCRQAAMRSPCQRLLLREALAMRPSTGI